MSDKPKVVSLHGARETPAAFLQELADSVRAEEERQEERHSRLVDVVVVRLYYNSDGNETIILNPLGSAMSAFWCLARAQIALAQGHDE